MKNKAVIFDMDGVISDTQKYHGQVELGILTQFGINTIGLESTEPITPEWIGQNYAGVQPKEWMRNLFQSHNKLEEFDIEIIEKKKNNLLYQKYKSGEKINFIKGADDLIYDLFDSGEFYISVITASTRDCMNHVLKSLKIKHILDDYISIYDIDPKLGRPYTSKSAPNVYNNIKDKYKIGNRFVMIEDGAAGMNGAIKAGGKAIAILGTNSKEKFPQAASHHHDLSDISLEEINKLVE